MYQDNRIKARLAGGEQLFGAWVGSGHPGNAEVMSHAGFDLLVVDNEHGQGDLASTVQSTLVARQTPCVVRVPSADPVWIKQALDRGLTSFMIPSVTGPAMARDMVAATRYPPKGNRGYAAGVVRASTFGLEQGYLAKADDNILLIAQIESHDTIALIPEIAAIDGIDMLFIGPNDLAGSIGRLEQLAHPDVVALIDQAEALMRQTGKPMGTITSPARSMAELIARGYQMIIGPHDVAMLRDASRASVEGFADALRGGKAPTGPSSSY